MNSKVLDESIAESLQTLDLMCFSEQYYFLVALISFGMLLVTMGVTTFINTNYNFFGDPVMPVLTQRHFLRVSQLQLRVDGVNATFRHRDAVEVVVRESTGRMRELRQFRDGLARRSSWSSATTRNCSRN